MFKDFVNRETETSYILEQLNTTSENNKVIIIFAESGIGKSRFSQKIIEETDSYSGLKINMVQSENTSFSSGFFLKRIAEELHNLSNHDNDLDSLDQFLKKLPDKELKKDFWESVLKGSIRPTMPKFLRGIEVMYDRFFSRNQFNSRKIFESGHNASTNIYFHYIKNVLNQKPFLLNIENIQQIDVTSLEKLLTIVKSVKSCAFLFEYTLSDTNSTDAVARFGENFQSIIKDHINYVRLNKLAFKDFLLLVRSVDDIESEEVLKDAYAEYDGNLRRLIDLNVLFNSSVSTKKQFWGGEYQLLTKDATSLNISNLKPDDSLVLAVILVFGSEIYLDTLSNILRFNEQYDYISTTDCVNRLSSVHFLITVNENYQIQTDHDYILESAKNVAQFEKHLLLAFRMIDRYYHALINDEKLSYDVYKTYKNLFDLYLRFDPDRALQILDKIKFVAANYSNPSEAGSFLDDLMVRLKESEESFDNGIYLNFVNIYIYLGLYQKAYSLIDSLNSDASEVSLIFKAILLNRLDKHNECIVFINGICSDEPQNRLELCLKIVLMLSYQSLDQIDEGKRVYLSILENRQLHEFYEFGYFLRNVDVLLSLNEGLELMKKSIEFFFDKSDIHTAHSRIAVSMQLARLGHLKLARKELKEAEKILRNKTMERHILFNNRAVISMYSGDFSEDVIELLNLCLVTTTTSFDELVVKGNMLIFHANKDSDSYSVESLLSDILKLIAVEPDVNEHRIAYYNIAYFYQQTNNQELYDYYIMLCANINATQRLKFWEKRLTKDKSANNEFLLEFDFHGGFLTPWHFEIDQWNF